MDRVFFEFQCKNGIEFINIKLPRAWAVFSTKGGGLSSYPYSTLNLALHVGDDEQAVLGNRKIFAQAVGFSFEDVVCAQQVHGCEIKTVDVKERGRGTKDYGDALPETDGMITGDQQVILAAFFADCVPVYAVDPVKGVVGLAHAGWKGTLNGIAGRLIQKMETDFKTDPRSCFAFIGPSIGPCCYEVGEDIINKLNDPLLLNNCCFEKDGKWFLDLWEMNRRVLLNAGLTSEHIGIGGICTSCCQSFFSYRRDLGRTGRMAAFIRLQD